MIPQHSFNAGEVRLNYAQTPGTGAPLVLLHGAGSDWQSFLPLIPGFARQFQVTAIDLRGHGRSSWVRQGYRVLDYAADIRRFLREKIATPAILFGHSLGALVAIAVATQSPTLVRLLVLGDPPFYFHNLTTRESAWNQPFQELYHLLSTLHTTQEMDGYMAQHYPAMDPQRRKARAETMSHVDPAVIAAILHGEDVAGFDTDALLRAIACPVLLLRGNPALGSALRDEDVTYITERIPSCQVVTMQEVGHGLPAGASLSALEDFLHSV